MYCNLYYSFLHICKGVVILPVTAESESMIDCYLYFFLVFVSDLLMGNVLLIKSWALRHRIAHCKREHKWQGNKTLVPQGSNFKTRTANYWAPERLLVCVRIQPKRCQAANKLNRFSWLKDLFCLLRLLKRKQCRKHQQSSFTLSDALKLWRNLPQGMRITVYPVIPNKLQKRIINPLVLNYKDCSDHWKKCVFRFYKK